MSSAKAGTVPSTSAIRSRRRTKPGSRSFQSVSTGEAMKIDEYVPEAIPTIIAKAKSCRVAPPKMQQRRRPGRRSRSR